MNKITIINADVLAGLRGLASGSVHCVMTSPPYWGLRDYSLEPQVWGGVPGCEHEWGEKLKSPWADHCPGPNGRQKNTEAGHFKPKQVGPFCRLCGAWRGSFGLEPTIDLYVQHTVEIFREVRRVLRKDGTLWLNLGDSYCSGGAGGDYAPGGLKAGQPKFPGSAKLSSKGIRGGSPKHTGGTLEDQPNRYPLPGLKAKDLCMIPARLALALQADGAADFKAMQIINKLIARLESVYDQEIPAWVRRELDLLYREYAQAKEGSWWLRSDIIWAKPNPMPESCTDRPTTAHEHIFLLTKSAQYFYDAEAVREDCESGPSDIRKMEESKERIGGFYKNNEDLLCKASKHTNIGRKRSVGSPNGRNLRSVWTLATQPYPEAHFATFPTSIPERCIKAGTSEKGCCPKCGAPWVRVVEKPDMSKRPTRSQQAKTSTDEIHLSNNWAGVPKSAGQAYQNWRNNNPDQTTGWRPTCKCPHTEADLIPATVLDPFSGAGTTFMVAAKLGRDAIGIELNPQYVEMSIKRLKQELGFLAETEVLHSPQPARPLP